MADWGAGLQSIGNSMVSFGLNKYQQKQDDQRYKQRQADEMAARKEYAQFIANLNPPPERAREIWDQDKKLRMQVREQWQAGDGDQSQGPPAPGRWTEVGRDQVAPKDKQPQVTSFRQGNDTVTAVVDPDDPSTIKELGRGPTFDPRAHQGRGSSNRLGKLVRVAQPDGTLVLMRENSDGSLSPAMDDEGNPVEGAAWRPRQNQKTRPGEADAIGPAFDPEENPAATADVQFVDPSENRPLGQFRSEPTSRPASPKTKPVEGASERKPGTSAASPIDISSPEEADNLPPGTYVRLNGRIARVD